MILRFKMFPLFCPIPVHPFITEQKLWDHIDSLLDIVHLVEFFNGSDDHWWYVVYKQPIKKIRII